MGVNVNEPEMVELSTVEEAVALLDVWIAAYKDLLRDFRRLEERYHDAQFMRGIERSSAEGWELLYKVNNAPRKSPFDEIA